MFAVFGEMRRGGNGSRDMDYMKLVATCFVVLALIGVAWITSGTEKGTAALHWEARAAEFRYELIAA